MQGPVIDPTSRELDRDRLYNALKKYVAHSVPVLNIDAYAQKIYEANRTAGM